MVLIFQWTITDLFFVSPNLCKWMCSAFGSLCEDHGLQLPKSLYCVWVGGWGLGCDCACLQHRNGALTLYSVWLTTLVDCKFEIWHYSNELVSELMDFDHLSWHHFSVWSPEKSMNLVELISALFQPTLCYHFTAHTLYWLFPGQEKDSCCLVLVRYALCFWMLLMPKVQGLLSHSPD